MKQKSLAVLLILSLLVLSACSTQEKDNTLPTTKTTDANVSDFAFFMSQEYNASSNLNEFTLQFKTLDYFYSNSPEQSNYVQNKIYQMNETSALFHTYEDSVKKHYYVEDGVLIALDSVTRIEISGYKNDITYAVIEENEVSSFVSFSSQGVEVLLTPIDRSVNVDSESDFYFTQNDNDLNTSTIYSFDGTSLEQVRTSNATISQLSTFGNELLYALRSESKLYIDDTITAREFNATSGSSLVEVNGAYLIFDYSFGTPVSIITATADQPILFNLGVPKVLKGSKSLFWAKEKFNDSSGSIYQFDGVIATTVLSEINSSLIKGIDYTQVRLDNILYLRARTQDDRVYILAVNANDEVSVLSEITVADYSFLTQYQGVLYYGVHKDLGNSYYEHILYDVNNTKFKVLYRYFDEEN